MYGNMIKNAISSWKTGSKYICNPPVLDTDDDTIVFVNDLKAAYTELCEDGWKPANESYGSENLDGWFSVKKTMDGLIHNYIVMDSVSRYQKWVTATELAKKLNLLKKEDRITLFSVIVDGATLF